MQKLNVYCHRVSEKLKILMSNLVSGNCRLVGKGRRTTVFCTTSKEFFVSLMVCGFANVNLIVNTCCLLYIDYQS